MRAMRAQYYQVVKNGRVIDCFTDHQFAYNCARLESGGAIVIAVREPTDCRIHKITHLPPAIVPAKALAPPYGVHEEDTLP